VALRDPPTSIQIGFTEKVVLEGSSMRLEDGDGHPVALGPVRVPKEGPGLAADIKGALGGDVYRVRWSVLGEDGHSSSGEFRFGVDGPNGAPPRHAELLNATGGPADQAAASDGPLRIALRWLGLLGAALLVGGAVLLSRLRGRLEDDVSETVSRRWARLALIGWVLTLAGSIAGVIGAAGAGAGGARMSILLATSTGGLSLARLVGVVVTGIPGLTGKPGPRRDQYLGLAGAFFLGAEAVGGHVTAIDAAGARAAAIVAQGAHLAAAAMWVGGLAVLAYVIAGVDASVRPSAWRTAAVAFRPVAAISAAVVIATGVIASIREVQHKYFLLWSAYGRFLLAKWVLVAGMLVLGALVGRALARGPRGVAGLPGSSRSRPVGSLLRVEAVLGAAVLVFAATLVGVAQGRGQPLPAQKGSVLAGPAFANTVVGGGLVRVALSPAAPGHNRLTALLAHPVEAATAGGVQRSAPAPGDQEKMSVSLVCDCGAKPVAADLTPTGGAWRTDVNLPSAGVWRASLRIGESSSLAPVALRVATGSAPGAPAWEVSAIGDLSGPAARRCRSFELGLELALGFVNAKGGVGGRKVVVHSADDTGDPARARQLAEQNAGADLAVPCGTTAAVTAGILQKHMPVVVADALAPPTPGNRVYRLSADPYAEGWAAGRTVAHSTALTEPDVPRRVDVLVEDGDPGADRMVAGVKAALALAPAEAAKVEETPKPAAPSADVQVVTQRHKPGTPLGPLVLDAADAGKYIASLLAVDPTPLAAALDALPDLEVARPPSLLAASRAFDEAFLRSSKIGRRGDIKVFGEVAPDSGESLVYTKLVQTIFPGEQPSIDGLRGYMAGKAVATALAKGGDLAEQLKLLNLFSDGVVSGWSPAAPAAGSWRFFLYRGTFLSSTLQPGEKAEPGRFFAEGGAWSRVQTANVGLCGPQLTYDGPPPPCTAPPK
jgi:putative copper export protein